MRWGVSVFSCVEEEDGGVVIFVKRKRKDMLEKISGRGHKNKKGEEYVTYHEQKISVLIFYYNVFFL